jgi:hypothetical protein
MLVLLDLGVKVAFFAIEISLNGLLSLVYDLGREPDYQAQDESESGPSQHHVIDHMISVEPTKLVTSTCTSCRPC